VPFDAEGFSGDKIVAKLIETISANARFPMAQSPAALKLLK
jgi:hypothetical protein